MAKKFAFYEGHSKDDPGFYTCLSCGHYHVAVAADGGLWCEQCGESIPDKTDQRLVAQTFELCPCCGRVYEAGDPFVSLDGKPVEGVSHCKNCGAVIGIIPADQRDRVVKNAWARKVEVNFQQFYGLTLLNADGSTEYVHGWFDVRTGKITQTG